MNELLTLFPDPSSTIKETKIPKDKILDILEYAMPCSWQRQMVLQGFDPIEYTVSDLVDFCKRMESTETENGTRLLENNGVARKKGNRIQKRVGNLGKESRKKKVVMESFIVWSTRLMTCTQVTTFFPSIKF